MKRISRRNFLKAMGISATALTLAACGGSSSSTAAGTAGSTAASAVATGEPKAGGTLRLCYSSPIATPGYTPRATGNAAIYYLTLSYESLTSYDAEGNMIPNLATEWDVNTDELSITWTLREGVNFADGEPFNAEAVKRNIEEYQANNRTETANIASCEVIDDTHIKMMMAEPNSSTLESVGFFVYYMSPKALENPSSLDAATCGTGPFQLSEFENNAYAIYTKNENYWKEGLPYLDSVEVTLVTESSTANTAFQANEYDCQNDRQACGAILHHHPACHSVRLCPHPDGSGRPRSQLSGCNRHRRADRLLPPPLWFRSPGHRPVSQLDRRPVPGHHGPVHQLSV